MFNKYYFNIEIPSMFIWKGDNYFLFFPSKHKAFSINLFSVLYAFQFNSNGFIPPQTKLAKMYTGVTLSANGC